MQTFLQTQRLGGTPLGEDVRVLRLVITPNQLGRVGGYAALAGDTAKVGGCDMGLLPLLLSGYHQVAKAT